MHRSLVRKNSGFPARTNRSLRIVTAPRRFESHDEIMLRALEIARRGEGLVEPNPMVGAVLVDDKLRPISEGWHEQCGGPHAEVNAIERAGDKANGATLFVTLEPCNHFGRTPPCSQAVINAGIRRVFIGATDPAVHSDKAGIETLKQAGLKVHVGILKDEAKTLIAPFRKRMQTGKPWVIAKWAMTLDGKIASRTGHSKWISSEQSRALVHKIRGRVDAIIVGSGTVAADDPALTARPQGPRTALRVVLDRRARMPLDSQLVRTSPEIQTLVFASESAETRRIEKLRSAGVEVETNWDSLSDVLEILGRRECTNVLVEGGSEVLGSFFDEQEIDESHIFIAPKIVGGFDAATPVAGMGLDCIPELSTLVDPTVSVVDSDIYVVGRMHSR